MATEFPTPAPAAAMNPPASAEDRIANLLQRALAKIVPATPPAALGPDDAAGYLGFSRSTLDAYAAAGLVPAPAKIGGKVLYCRAELDAWLAHGGLPRAEWLPIWRKLRSA